MTCGDLAPVAKAALGRRLCGLSSQVMPRVDAALSTSTDPGRGPAPTG